MGDHSAFFYGTLMEPQVLYRVCYGSSNPTSFQKSLLKIRPAILHHHCRHRVLDRDYPAIVSSPEDSVRGTYVQGLTDGDIIRLDIFEGDEYERRKVKIRGLEVEGDDHGKGNVVGPEAEADTYIWVAGNEKLDEGEWDFGEFRREKMQRWIGNREEYNQRRSLNTTQLIMADIDEVARARDGDPTGGRGRNGIITGNLNNRPGKSLLESAV
ncbi:MAG: hypothetical protein Q9170_002589 [Blastenia crenularia]